MPQTYVPKDLADAKKMSTHKLAEMIGITESEFIFLLDMAGLIEIVRLENESRPDYTQVITEFGEKNGGERGYTT